MAGIALSTAGVKLSYAVEATAGTKPVTGFTHIEDIKEVPSFNPSPETHEATDLEETEYKFYVAGLKDVGGALEFTANFTEKLQNHWAEIVEAYNTASGSGKRMWFQITHPRLPKSLFFTGEPSYMGMPGMSVNSVMETTVYITPTSAPTWDTKIEPVKKAAAEG